VSTPSEPPISLCSSKVLSFSSYLIPHNQRIRITKVYESETYDYPVQIQESISELSSSIGYNITSFAASNLKGTNLPVPVPSAPAAPPVAQHKTLPHALVRAAHMAATATGGAGEEPSRLNRSLTYYATAWEKIASARLDQDAAIRENFLHPWQTTLNTSIGYAMKARQAVRMSRLELDAAKQTYVFDYSVVEWSPQSYRG